MLGANQIKRLILHTKKTINTEELNRPHLIEETYYRGLIDGLELVLSMNKKDVNNNPLNKEQNHELSLPIRHGYNPQSRE